MAATPRRGHRSERPRLAVWKFASCDGCQLSLLDCEDELLAVADAVQIANFAEASSAIEPGPYDLSLVEGSITTAHDAERILEVRKQSKYLVTIGACATAGGIQALRNFTDVNDYIAAVYATPRYIETLATSTPISAHVPVDFELQGCPINKAQLIEAIIAFLAGRKPAIAVADPVRGACEILGLDPLYVANEGRFTAIVSPNAAENCVGMLRRFNEAAAIIGRVEALANPGIVNLQTLGGARTLDLLSGEQLPRIC